MNQFAAACENPGFRKNSLAFRSSVIIGHPQVLVPVVDMDKGIFLHFAADALIAEPGSQPVMAVHVELQPKRSPGRHAEIAQAEIGIDEVEIVEQALARIVLHKRLA